MGMLNPLSMLGLCRAAWSPPAGWTSIPAMVHRSGNLAFQTSGFRINLSGSRGDGWRHQGSAELKTGANVALSGYGVGAYNAYLLYTINWRARVVSSSDNYPVGSSSRAVTYDYNPLSGSYRVNDADVTTPPLDEDLYLFGVYTGQPHEFVVYDDQVIEFANGRNVPFRLIQNTVTGVVAMYDTELHLIIENFNKAAKWEKFSV